jgi:hypothetical protein
VARARDGAGKLGNGAHACDFDGALTCVCSILQGMRTPVEPACGRRCSGRLKGPCGVRNMSWCMA